MTNFINTLDIETSLMAVQADKINTFLHCLNVAVAEAKSSYEAERWRPESEWDKGYWLGLDEALVIATEVFGEVK